MSSSRNVVRNFALETAKSMSTSFTTEAINLDRIDQACFQVTWTSANAVGVLSVQGSVDGTNFVDLTFTPPLQQPASDSAAILINLALIPFTWVRLAYTATSGTGTLSANVSLKGV